MWVKITKDHDHWPNPRRMLSFKAGVEQSVKRDIGEALIKAGVAEEIAAPPSGNAETTTEGATAPTETKTKK
jgi:hypothetical protein